MSLISKQNDLRVGQFVMLTDDKGLLYAVRGACGRIEQVASQGESRILWIAWDKSSPGRAALVGDAEDGYYLERRFEHVEFAARNFELARIFTIYRDLQKTIRSTEHDFDRMSSISYVLDNNELVQSVNMARDRILHAMEDLRAAIDNTVKSVVEK